MAQLDDLTNPIAQKLIDLLEKFTRKNLYYYRKRIDLDGLTFVECSFENCEFYTETGAFVLLDCRIYGPETKFIYGKQALKIVRLYELMNTSVNGKIVFPNIFPKVDTDGRITIQ